MTTIEPKDYTPPGNALEGRVILVTGAGAGIGRATALACAQQGASVALLGRTLSKLESVYDKIVEAGWPRPSIAQMNLTKAQGPDYFQLANSVEKEFGRLDGLLHNASMLGQMSPIEQYDVGVWTEVMHVNLTAPFVMTQVMLPLLRKSADASILFTSSGVGRKGRAYWGAYSVSKFGTEALSQILAEETEQYETIRVNCINPGRTRTTMRAAAYPGEDPLTLKEPHEIVAAYLYLLGPDSQGVSGQSFDAQ
jgi:NAD(P)-dependent dehydrogenase (short-subunit alcohol dehydrogenase family)